MSPLVRARITLALCAFCVSATFAQSKPAPLPPGLHPAFASVTIKAHEPASTRNGVSEEGDHIHYFNQTVEDLIVVCYGLLKPDQIVDEPAWMQKERFDLDVVYHPPDLGHNYRQDMLGALLAERFHLVVHSEKRVRPVYNLMIAAGGTKLGPPIPGRKSGVNRQQQNGEMVMTFTDSPILYLELNWTTTSIAPYSTRQI